MMNRVWGKYLLPFVFTGLCVCGCTPPDGGGNGGGDPTPGGQGIPEGTYSGTLQCTETTSRVSEADDSETVIGQSSPSFAVSYSFNDDGMVLDSSGNPVTEDSVGSTTIGGVTGTATVRTVTASTDRLIIISDAIALVDVTGSGQTATRGVVTAVYEFDEPNTVSVATEKVFTSNVVDGEYIKIEASCSASLAYQP
jgi:hypothetical protein